MALTTKRVIKKIRSSSCSMPGVWRAVGHVDGAVVIFHSPRACAHIAGNMGMMEHFRKVAKNEYEEGIYTAPRVSSLLTEKHAIFGGAERLAECIGYVVATYAPKVIVIANSCVVGVIGDDVESVAAEAEAEWGLPILTVPCYGYLDGEYYAGYFYTAEAVLDRLVPPSGKAKNGKVLLIGDQGGPNSEYGREIRRLLAYFELEIMGQFPSYVSFAELPQVADSSLNIVLGSKGATNVWLVKLAQKMEKLYGTPYYGDIFPTGWEDTQKWLEGLGLVLGRTEAAQAAVAEEKRRFQEVCGQAAEQIRGQRAVLCIGRSAEYYDPAWMLKLIPQIGLELTGVVLLDAYDDEGREKMTARVKAGTAVPIIAAAKQDELLAQADIILTTHELNERPERQLFLPLLPRAGLAGDISLIQKIKFVLARRRSNGGIVYG